MNHKQIIALAIVLATITGCSSPDSSTSQTPTSEPVTSQPTTSTITSTTDSLSSSSSSAPLLEFEGVTFTNQTIVYDGQSHTIDVSGQPSGTQVNYVNHGPHTNVGVYNMSATLNKSGYQPLTLQATLTINRTTFTGLTFKDVTVEYNGLDRKNDIVTTGIAPTNTTITYTYRKDSEIVNELIDVGEYAVTAEISNPNFTSLSLQAKLTIISTETRQYMVMYNGSLYFSNAQDRSMLYRYDGSAVTKFSSDVPTHFADLNFGTPIFISKSIFVPSISSIRTGKTQIELSTSAQYLESYGTNVYFVSNKLTQDDSGIYKMTVDGLQEPVVTKLYSGKAKYLHFIDNYLYFADGRNDDKLSRISINTSLTSTAQLVVDEKIKELDGNTERLVFTVNNLLGDYLATYRPSTGVFTKLTIDAARYPQIVGTDVYYSNVDLLTSGVYGKGIYRVPLDGTKAAQSGVKVLQGDEYNLSSLYHYNNVLYFYRVSDKALFAYNLGTQAIVNILQDFVAPELIPLSLGGKTQTVGTKVYYTNIYENKSLYVYDSIANTNTKLTSAKVEDFLVSGDYLFINQVSFLVNNDLFVVNIKVGGIPTKISTDDARSLTRDGNQVYYVRHNEIGAASAIVRVNIDGTGQVEFYNYGASNLRIHDGKLYFIDGERINYITTSSITPTSSNLTATRLGSVDNIEKFEIDGTNVFYTYRTIFTKELRRSPLSSFGTNVTLASSKTDPKSDPIDFVVGQNDIYYYSKADLGVLGIYRVAKTASGDGTATKVLSTNSIYYASSMSMSNNLLSFISYYTSLLGNSHVYLLDVSKPAESLPLEIDTIY